jgi:ferritin-like metal-binding protein YciE
MAKSESNGSAATKRGQSTAKKSSAKTAGGEKKRSLDDVLESLLKDIYYAEKQLLEAIPEMAEAAYSEELRDAFEEHLQQTKRHVERLEKVFDRLQIEKKEEKCEAIEGMISEAQEIISEFEEGSARDAALIIAAQKVEHYEIASYGSICEIADVLGYTKIADILDRTLEEEENTDELLSTIAEHVNEDAYEESFSGTTV